MECWSTLVKYDTVYASPDGRWQMAVLAADSATEKDFKTDPTTINFDANVSMVLIPKPCFDTDLQMNAIIACATHKRCRNAYSLNMR
jgi:hypothetical protein